MQYDVTILRTEYRQHTFTVKATDPDDALLAGMRAADDYDFNCSPVFSANNYVEAITPTDVGQKTKTTKNKRNSR